MLIHILLILLVVVVVGLVGSIIEENVKEWKRKRRVDKAMRRYYE